MIADEPMAMEEIPNHLVVAELEQQLFARISDLVIANARIRARDHTIDLLRGQLNAAHAEMQDLRINLDNSYNEPE